MRDINLDEVENLILFAEGKGLDIRFIEYMPNRYGSSGEMRYVSSGEIRKLLPWKFYQLPHAPGSAAQYFHTSSLGIRIGFISSVSKPFCSSCNRLRLTADGSLYSCLFNNSGINLFNLLSSDRVLQDVEICIVLRQVRASQSEGELDDERMLGEQSWRDGTRPQMESPGQIPCFPWNLQPGMNHVPVSRPDVLFPGVAACLLALGGKKVIEKRTLIKRISELQPLGLGLQ